MAAAGKMAGMTERVIVVGGGIAGSSAAYRLACRGLDVILIDRSDPGHATAAGAGIVSPATSFSAPPAQVPLALRSAAYYPQVVAQLADDGITDTGYAVPGGLVIAGEADGQQLDKAYRLLAERREAGVTNIGELTMLDSAGARVLFPPLADGIRAIHLSGAARVNGRTMRDALQQAARRRGAEIRTASAELAVEGSRAVGVRATGIGAAEVRAAEVPAAGARAAGVRSAGVRADGELITAAAVILATGAWVDAWDGQAVPVPLAPQRGQIVHLDLPETDTSRWPVVVGPGDPYLLGFPPHRVVAGATREDGTGFDYRLTAGGQAELLTATLARAPGLAGATVAEWRVGFRPYAPDRLPVLGRAPGLDNVWLANGLGASGLTMGPYVGAAAADLACGDTLPFNVAPFDPGRFAGH